MNDDESRYTGVLSTLSASRRIVRNSFAVFLLAFLLITLVLSYRIGAVVSAGLALSYALLQLLGARYCVTCGLSVSRLPWSTQAIPCPSCGSECRFAWRSHT